MILIMLHKKIQSSKKGTFQNNHNFSPFGKFLILKSIKNIFHISFCLMLFQNLIDSAMLNILFKSYLVH